MSDREELGRIIWETSRRDEGSISATGANIVADAILADGWVKVQPITQWGVMFTHNGAFYKEYHSREAAQEFANEMSELGALMVVVSREYVHASYSEWEEVE